MTEAIWNGTHILSAILNSLSGMFYRCRYDQFWTMMYVTKGCYKLTGYDPEELLYNKSIAYSQLIHPDDLEMVNRVCEEQILNRKSIDIQYRLQDKNGIVKRVKETAAAIYDEQGRVLFIEGFIVEADALREKEQLSEELQLYRKVIDVNLMCSVTDARGKIIYVNQRFCDIAEYTKEELLSRTHAVLKSGYHPEAFFEEMWQTISVGNVWYGEIMNKTKHGRSYWVDAVIMPILRHGKVIRFFSIMHNISKRKEAEEKNRQHLRAMEKMLYMISHELRQPVATALGLIELINTDDLLEAEERTDVIHELKMKVMEIELFTRKLTNYIHEHKILRE